MSDLFEDKNGVVRARKTHCINGHEFDGTERWHTNWKGYKSRVCKICDRERMRRKREKPYFLARQAENQRQYRKRMGESYLEQVRKERHAKKEWLDSFKKVCSRCGETRIACLEFHHKNPAEKDFLLSVGVAKYSLERLKAEIDKCEVICSNCHRVHHWEEKHKGEK